MILVGCPSVDGWIVVELMNFAIEIGQSGYDVRFQPIKKRATDHARNMLVDMAQRSKRHLIMFDSDCIPAKGTFLAMAKKISAEECVAAMPYCSVGGTICVGEHPPTIQQVDHLTGWTRADNVGTHCIGYNVKVFDRIAKPYFTYEQGTSEDYICHRKLHAAGVPIYVHYGLWAEHAVTKVMGKPQPVTKETIRMLEANI